MDVGRMFASRRERDGSAKESGGDILAIALEGERRGRAEGGKEGGGDGIHTFLCLAMRSSSLGK